VTMVHSERPTNCNSNASCNYQIIHAYGGQCTVRDENDDCVPGTFSRKVIRTPNVFEGFPSPSGFGRIKLWD
jgi:hypothetical protein